MSSASYALVKGVLEKLLTRLTVVCIIEVFVLASVVVVPVVDVCALDKVTLLVLEW